MVSERPSQQNHPPPLLTSHIQIVVKEGETKRFIIEPHSPYYFHPSDGPGELITAKVFDGENYDLWEKVVELL